ncbi:unnamed protein product, partial [Enterobius vermicularis]|uniref:Myosin motor domain-containing protein n=1 Tax=Enterobius vermicularis TaxID=51028 RepID=A0A0N4VHM6_ENTVE
FGNAKTVRNDNSSRFGKYIDIHFRADGAIEGARVEQYLLEKSRIVNQAHDERNYHIFYCLLAGLSQAEKDELYLRDAKDYYYLTQGKTLVADGRDDAADLAEIRSAMKVLFFKEPEIKTIFKILAALLHIGNIKYSATMLNNMEATEIRDRAGVARVAKLLQVDERTLVNALTTRSLVTREERVVSCLTAEQSLDVRDALVKGIYGRLFISIVNKINDAIYRPQKPGQKRRNIGVLDIFGFENFTMNSFEQLCINYANENLQQFFVRHVFRLEQREYEAEKIDWKSIEYTDNQDVLDIIAMRPMNIFSIIDEESIFPRGTDQTMLNKLHANHSINSRLYLKPKSDLNKSFGIVHFAGAVFYRFLEKNRDTFSPDLYSLVQSSKIKFLVNLFEPDMDAENLTGTRRKQATVSGQFRKSLEALMSQIALSEPFFIRCIKPNEYKRALMFDRDLVCKQLRYSGMMETIKIRKAGYPIRYSYPYFVARYRILLDGIGPPQRVDCKQATKEICDAILGRHADYQLGATKVFLKDAQELHLEQEHDRMVHMRAVLIQKTLRGWLQRKKFHRMRDAAIIIQKHYRGYAQRRRYLQMQVGFARLQAVLRTRQLVLHYQHLKSIVIQFQALCRGAMVREAIKSKRERGERRPAMMTETDESPREPSPASASTSNDELDDSRLVEQISDTPSPTDIIAPMEEIGNEDLSGFQFGKFAATYFQGQATPQHIKKPLRAPLLLHEDPGHQLDRTSVMGRLYETLGRKFTKKDVALASKNCDYDQLSGTQKIKKSSSVTQKFIQMTLRKKTKLAAIEQGGDKETKAIIEGIEAHRQFNAFLDDRPTSNLDKLHYIIGHGILRSELRDEIYCQICKQLTNNPSRSSNARGWILLSLCVGCFAPSDRFIKYLYCFVRENGPKGSVNYSSYIEQRLRRTVANGTRHQPPSYIELQATKSKKNIVLSITLMDESVKSLNADSATTAKELCEALSQKIGLKDRFGFSLYIALFDKVSSLGAGTDHVMDAISQCEQYAKEQGRLERNAPWRLFFRKEIFSPWHDTSLDPVGTDLVYQQVVRGVKYGEYRTDKDEDLALLIAQQFYIDYGSHLDVNDIDKLEESLQRYLPDYELKKSSNDNLQRWLQLVMHAYRKKFKQKEITKEEAKGDVVKFAKFKWPLLFSRFYEAFKFAGPPLAKNEVIIAVNWTGIYVVDDQEQVLLEFSFPEVTGILCSAPSRACIESFTIQTVGQDEYTFQSPNAEDIKELVSYFLNGLSSRSRYLVALQENSANEAANYLEFKRGDLLLLSDGLTGGSLSKHQFVRGENARTGRRGNIPVDLVRVLPTLEKPTIEVLETFAKQPEFDSLMNRQVALVNASTTDRPYTLERFAADNFRTPPKRTLTLGSRKNDRSSNGLWMHSRDPIKMPLLKKLIGKEEPSSEAVNMFMAILKYMGDHPSKKPRSGTELTDQIFKGPLRYEILRDELYCQLMKQLTANFNPFSEEWGWELLWLGTGLFPPSQSLLKEVLQFLRSREHPVAADCYNRLQKTLRSGRRKFPPHQVEVEAIQHKTTQIFHKAFFPDGSEEAIEVESSTRARDFCQRIATRLRLKSSEGFSLFVKFDQKVISVPENEFFFDFVRQIGEWARQMRAAENAPPYFSYQVRFMKKLWMNVVPGEDTAADLIFHYPQELPKYLKGYHKVTRQQAVELAALIVRASTQRDKYPSMSQVQQKLKDFVPEDLLQAYNKNDWKKQIAAAYGGNVENMSPEEAKITFLQRVAQWPTFGSAFFEVKQSSDPALPNKLLIAINKTGVNLYDLVTKDHIGNYPFSSISNWTKGNTYFHMTVGNLTKGNRLLLETSLGYKMDDLLTSYIRMLLSSSNTNRATAASSDAEII